jgi:hypothetical protein
VSDVATTPAPTTAVATADPDPLVRQADLMFRSGMAKDAKNAAQLLVKFQAARSLGFDPILASSQIYIGVGGKGGLTFSATLQAAIAKRAGYRFKIVEHTNQKCSVEVYERWPDGSMQSCGPPVTFTIDDAKAAKITSNPTWTQYPKNMLWSRAITNAIRWHCSDAIGGTMYTPDELNPSIPMKVDAASGEISYGTVVEAEVVDPTPPPTKPAGDPVAEMRRLMVDLMAETKTPEAVVLNHYKASSLARLSDHDVADAIRNLEMKKAATNL